MFSIEFENLCLFSCKHPRKLKNCDGGVINNYHMINIK
jgi:hypothetical protein